MSQNAEKGNAQSRVLRREREKEKEKETLEKGLALPGFRFLSTRLNQSLCEMISWQAAHKSLPLTTFVLLRDLKVFRGEMCCSRV